MDNLIVTAAIIQNRDQVLLAQRNPGGPHGLCWEFPGGKLEAGEEPRSGLRREIKEELGLEITVGSIFAVESYPEMGIVLLFYLCNYTGGQARTLDCRDFRWVRVDQLEAYDLAPADHLVAGRLGTETGRSRRKVEHISHFLRLSEGGGNSGFNDVRLVHCALPETDWREVDLSWSAFGKRAKAPLLINAITGGAREVAWINRALARCAARFGLAMAVGSQTAALEAGSDQGLVESFSTVRKENPKGIILANVGAGTSPESAARAVEMIKADALQIHLNVPQELAMAEGERRFAGWRRNIEELVESCKVPVIIKEVGFGLSREVIFELKAVGVQHFDIGGAGGTNFIAIEEQRSRRMASGLEGWGISTACSTVEAYKAGVPGQLFATGGILSALDGAKALSLGATAFGVAGQFLRSLCEQSESVLWETAEEWLNQLRRIYLMCGAKNTAAMRRTPVVITGYTAEWLSRRGIDLKEYAGGLE